jgi:hypothetical protein
MTVTGQNQSARRKTCSSVIFTIKIPKYTELESNPGLGFEELATKRLTGRTRNIRDDEVCHLEEYA